MARPIGDFARLNADAIRRAEMMQGLAISNIRQTFEAEDDELRADNLRWDIFVRDLEATRQSGDWDAFNQRIASIMAPALMQVLQEQQQPQPQGPQGQPGA